MSGLFGDITESTGDMSLQQDPIPNKTQVLAVIDEAKFDTFDGEEFISVVWTVLKPSEYANRKIFQKIRVFDEDEDKKKRQQKMLAAIDQNASGGALIKLGKMPSDDDLMRHLSGKQMVLRLAVWEMGGNTGNWVSQVSAKGELKPAAPLNKTGDDLPF